MCDAARGWQGSSVELLELGDDISSGGESSSETEEIFRSVEAQA